MVSEEERETTSIKIKPHPMQNRIDDARSIPSLVTGGKRKEYL